MPRPRRRTRPTSSNPLDDALASAKRGDEQAFRELYDQLAPQLTWFVRSRVSDHVDDLVSETFLGAFNGIAGFEGDANDFRAWVYRICRNKITDHHRRTHRQVRTEEIDADALARHTTVGDAVADAAHLDDDIEALLAPLTPEQREVIALRVVADLPIERVAEILDKPAGAVKSLQHRALETIRRNIPDEGVSP